MKTYGHLVVLVGAFLAGCASVNELTTWDGRTEHWLLGRLGKPDLEEGIGANVPDIGTGQTVAVKIQERFPGYTYTVRHMQWYSWTYYTDAYLVKDNGKWIVIDAVKWHKDVRF